MYLTRRCWDTLKVQAPSLFLLSLSSPSLQLMTSSGLQPVSRWMAEDPQSISHGGFFLCSSPWLSPTSLSPSNMCSPSKISLQVQTYLPTVVFQVSWLVILSLIHWIPLSDFTSPAPPVCMYVCIMSNGHYIALIPIVILIKVVLLLWLNLDWYHKISHNLLNYFYLCFYEAVDPQAEFL